MGFGSFTLGYLLGQSFQNSQDIIETPGKCQADYDNDNDPELRAYGEECYWKAWDRAFKEKVIERLSSGERIHASIYPDIVSKRWVELITSGEIKLIANINTPDTLRYIWTNMECEYAQRDGYKEFYKKDVEPCLNNSSFRIVS